MQHHRSHQLIDPLPIKLIDMFASYSLVQNRCKRRSQLPHVTRIGELMDRDCACCLVSRGVRIIIRIISCYCHTYCASHLGSLKLCVPVDFGALMYDAFRTQDFGCSEVANNYFVAAFAANKVLWNQFRVQDPMLFVQILHGFGQLESPFEEAIFADYLILLQPAFQVFCQILTVVEFEEQDEIFIKLFLSPVDHLM